MSIGDLAQRMKAYEESFRHVLPRRLPIVVRVDGKAFSRLTSRLEKPFDSRFVETMDRTAIELCTEIQGAQMAYVQSDEISVLIHGYKRFQSSSWFDNQLQKIVSISAALASSRFTLDSHSMFDPLRPVHFDSRAFVVPEHDVENYFVHRQQDAERNSVQMMARAHFSHKQCDGRSCVELKTMLEGERALSWEDLPIGTRRGRVVVHDRTWIVRDAPRFVEEGSRRWIHDLLMTKDDGST